jgi:glycosyltransferase involved in cell wall biosynthesis
MLMVHFINSFNGGGAERVCLNSVRWFDDCEHVVVYLRKNPTHLKNEFGNSCKIISCLEIFKLFATLRKPNVVFVSYLYFASVFAEVLMLFVRLFGARPLHILQIHNGLGDQSVLNLKTIILCKTLQFTLSYNSTRVVYCSHFGQINHMKKFGFPIGDVVHFYPLEENAFKHTSVSVVNHYSIGIISRWDSQKGVDWLISVAPTLDALRSFNCELHFYGVGLTASNLDLQPFLDGSPSGLIQLHGFKDDVDKIFDAHSLFLLPSRSEAMPQVVFETLNRGKNIISSDVGDTNQYLDDKYLFQFGDTKKLNKCLKSHFKQDLTYHTTNAVKFTFEHSARQIRKIYDDPR